MILVIGSGVAGLACAIAAARAGAEVTLATPGTLGESAPLRPLSRSKGAELEADVLAADVLAGGVLAADALAGGSTALAQGGIAAAIGAGDTPAQHLADTLAAGAGLVDREAAEALTASGARAVRRLLAEGFAADRGPDGGVALGLEAAHGRHRIVHAGGDRSGAVLHAFLAGQVRALAGEGRILLRERRTAVSLLTVAGIVAGAVLRGDDGLEACRAEATVLATGGYAGLYPRSSNPVSSRGAGVVLAARVGALVADLEFVQFHPTVLHGTGALISEAVRGAGAVLLDGSGSRFMADRHPLAELAPRDVVSREISGLLRDRGEESVLLDATGIERAEGAGALARRFPGISAATAALGYDWTREPIPVSPAAHYTMGGVASDLDGRTSVPGLFVAGEAASTGVHGANRLASNSLLEGLVFGERAGLAAHAFADGARGSADGWTPRGAGFAALERGSRVASVPAAPLPEEALAAVPSLTGLRATSDDDAALVGMISAAALERTESRGAHQRFDHPGTDPAQAERRAYRFVLPATGDRHPDLVSASEQRSLSSC